MKEKFEEWKSRENNKDLSLSKNTKEESMRSSKRIKDNMRWPRLKKKNSDMNANKKKKGNTN